MGLVLSYGIDMVGILDIILRMDLVRLVDILCMYM